MARGIGRKPGVYGPYRHYDRFRIQLVDERGTTTYQSYATEQEAKQVRRSLQREFSITYGKTIGEAIDLYETYLRDVKGNKLGSIATTMSRLRRFFPDPDTRVGEVSDRKAAEYYTMFTAREGERTKKKVSVDSHRNTLAEARTFLGWCVAKPQRFVSRNPLAEV